MFEEVPSASTLMKRDNKFLYDDTFLLNLNCISGKSFSRFTAATKALVSKT